MRAASYFPQVICAGFCSLALVVPISDVLAQQDSTEDESAVVDSSPSPVEPAPEIVRPPHLVVLRLSAEMLGSQLERTVDITTPVQDVILGTPVTGVARLVGQPHVELSPSDDKAHFSVIFKGTVYSRTIGHGGPATVHGHSITYFTARKEVIYHPGQGFQSSPATVEARSQCFTDNIATSRGGIVGRIIQRRASEQVASQRPQITAIARQRASRRIETAFDRQLAQRIAQLNQAVDFQVKLAGLRTRPGTRHLTARTTPQYLEIADSIDSRLLTVDLPSRPAVANSTPIEIWVHGSVVPETISESLKTIFTNPDQSALLNGLALLPGTFGKEAAAAITTLAAENKVGVQNVGEWFVIDLNVKKKDPTESARIANSRMSR